MECTHVPSLPEGENWVYEIKQDGYRAIGLVDGNSAMLYSMSGQDYSSEFRHITFALKSLRQGNLVLDGEIVALDELGRARFQELVFGERPTSPLLLILSLRLHALRVIVIQNLASVHDGDGSSRSDRGSTDQT